jgi:hypothetical protein
MSKKVNNINFNEGILSYDINSTTNITKVKLNLLEKIKHFRYNGQYFIGGNNIVLVILINGKKYALRISIISFENNKCDGFINEIKMMYRLKNLDLGVDIYYPPETETYNINDMLIQELNNTEKYHTFSIIQYCEKGSVYNYIVDDEKITFIKKDKIDQIFVIIDKLIENNIFCYDIKFINFVIDGAGNVKIIDIGDCYPCDFFSIDYDYKLIYESIVKIQLFHNCPLLLMRYFTSKLNFEKIYTSYIKLHNDDSIYSDTNYKILLKNLFWYYRDLKINYENITEIFDISKFKDPIRSYIIKHQFKEILNLNDEKLYPFIKYYLFLIFSIPISYDDDTDNKQIFCKMYKNYSNLDNEISDESTDKTDVNNGCKILDGKKSRRRRKSKNKSRKKSIRHKKK